MLPKFRVSLDEATMVPWEDLKSTVAAVFEKIGVPPEDAQLGADVLVVADLRGVDSHGVSNMLRSYVNGYTSGQINPNPTCGSSAKRQAPPTSTPTGAWASSPRPRRWRWPSARPPTSAWAW